uniref:Putative phosphoadenosine phosphosulfate n=2 Tax=viral metagenome TaxID=1070528 RepID=A0A6M3L0K1_9ZZZZ
MTDWKLADWQLKQRQSLPLEIKERLTAERIKAWYKHWSGDVYVAFSGGKDSTVLLHQVRRLYPDVPAVFLDTGLEFPEVKSFVRETDNVVWMRPNVSFLQVIQRWGYPVISKEVSRYISDIRRGLNIPVGRVLHGCYLPKKWAFLLEAPFLISEYCCTALKKLPSYRYENQTKRKCMLGTLAVDSRLRARAYYKTGCNNFESKRPKSTPLAFWLEQDIWDYIHQHNIPYCSIYDQGEKSTGCVFCLFGIMRDKDRFKRLENTHPQLHTYCMDKLGVRQVLEFLRIE